MEGYQCQVCRSRSKGKKMFIGTFNLLLSVLSTDLSMTKTGRNTTWGVFKAYAVSLLVCDGIIDNLQYYQAGIFSKSNVLSGYFLSLISRLQIRLDATPDCAF